MSNKQSQAGFKVPMIIIAALFFIFGFVTWLNGALIPFLKTVCDLTTFQALFVTFAFYIAYTVMALPMASVLERTGYKKGMGLGLLLIAAGCLLFVPAAYSREFGLFLAALFVMGSGLTILQTAVGPYVVKLGPSESAAVRISIMGLLNKGAGVVAPIVFTALVLSGISGVSEQELAVLSAEAKAAKLSELSDQLVVPYIAMAFALALLAVALMFAPIPELSDEGEVGQDDEITTAGILQFPQLILGAIALFFYVGVEVIAGDTIGLLGEAAGVPEPTSLTSYTMVFMVLGYLYGTVAIPRLISQQTALLFSAVMGFVFAIGVMTSSMESTSIAAATLSLVGVPEVPNAVFFLALLGFANALVWPAVWPLALEGLGKYTSKGAAVLVMGISGGALVPLIFGHFADNGDKQLAYWVMLPCYAVILFYALKGHKMKSWSTESSLVQQAVE